MQIARGTVTACVAALLLSLTGAGAWSQSQTRIIRVVTPNPAGATTDILARLLTEHISRTRSVTIIVENRPGAANVIATEAVSRAAPDGNTLLMTINSITIMSHLKKLSFDPMTAFEPICYLAYSPQAIVVPGSSPYRTLADLINGAHTAPGTLTMAAVGPATGAHIGFEMLKRAAKIDMTFVPYPGNAPAVNAVLGSHVTATISGYAAVAGQLKAGKLRALAVGTRIPELPDVPSLAELGYKDVEIDNWFGVVAPAKTPKDRLSQLSSWFTEAIQSPDVKSKLAALSLYPIGQCGADFAAFLRNQHEQYGRVIQAARIRLD